MYMLVELCTRSIGEFRGGEIEGNGRKRWPDGREYVGHFSRGEPHGEGCMRAPDGEEYVGEFERSQRHGVQCFLLYSSLLFSAFIISFSRVAQVRAACARLTAQCTRAPSGATRSTAPASRPVRALSCFPHRTNTYTLFIITHLFRLGVISRGICEIIIARSVEG